MKGLIQLQLRSVLSSRTSFFLLCFLILFTLYQGFRLRQYFFIYEMKGNIVDFLMFTMGGWQSPTLFTFIITSILFTFILLYISFISVAVVDQLFNYLLVRIQKRVVAWVATCVLQGMLSILLFVFLFLLHIVIGFLLFDSSWGFSEYSSEFYPEWANSSHSIKAMFVQMSILFCSGLFALFMLLHLVLLLPANRLYLYISFALFVIVTGIAYVYTDMPRYFAPMFYSSTVTLPIESTSFFTALAYNTGIIIGCTIIGCSLWRKRESVG